MSRRRQYQRVADVPAAMAGLPQPWRRDASEIAIMPGACLNVPLDIEVMKQQTHDGLIELLGARRRSRIWWGSALGWADCRNRLAELYPPDDTAAELLPGLAQFNAFFDEAADRSVLIVASCWAVR